MKPSVLANGPIDQLDQDQSFWPKRYVYTMRNSMSINSQTIYWSEDLTKDNSKPAFLARHVSKQHDWSITIIPFNPHTYRNFLRNATPLVFSDHQGNNF